MAKTEEDRMISDAIKGTEQEIFSSAFNNDEAEAGNEAAPENDRSLEEMGEGLEGQHEEGEDDAEIEASAGDEDSDAETEGDENRDPKTGQFKAKDGKAQTEDKGEKGDKAAKPAADGKAKPGADDGKGRVPAGRLREETKKREAADAERDAAKSEAAAVKQEVAGLSKRLDDLMAAIASGRLQQQKPADGKGTEEETAPDIFADPEGYRDFMERRIQRVAMSGNQNMEAMRVELSMQSAHDKYEGVFEEAYKAVTSLDKNNPNDVQIVRRIWSSPNPGKALVGWYNQVKTLREVGDDPAKYREKVANETREQLLNDEEFLNSVMEKMREKAAGNGGHGGNGKPRTVIRTPSLNAARGGGMGQLTDRRPLDGSDAGVFASAFED